MNEEILAAADRNMRAAWRALTSVGPVPGVVERDDALLLSSGVPIPLFNPAFVLGVPADPAGLVGDVMDHYASIGLPFILYFRDDVAPNLADACDLLVEHFRPPLMVLDPIVPAPAAPGVEIVTVDQDSIDAYRAVLGAGFGMPADLVEVGFPRAALDLGGMTFLLALADGVPVATSAVVVTDDVAGVYNVATAPEHRGRGFGAAITWAAVEAGAAAGCGVSVLQASEAGAPVYERMGFVTGDRYHQMERRS